MTDRVVATKTILLVEDQRDIREAMRELLELEGYRVLEAVHGRDALTALNWERPALILLDMMMPVMDGARFLEELFKRPELNEIPVVVVSAFHEGALPRRAIGFLQKPCSAVGLLEAVTRWAR